MKKKVNLKKAITPRRWRISRATRESLTSSETPAQIHVTTHDAAHKLAGIQSVSTSVLVNPICEKRRKDPTSPCFGCYADGLCKCYPNLQQALERNTAALTGRLLTMEEAADVPICSALARVESFGDVANVTQARNYLRIIITHRFSHWAAWTKNPGIWAAALHLEGVKTRDQMPANFEFVLSSMRFDQRDEIPAYFRPFCSKVFTVWSTPGAYDARPMVTGGNCFRCAGVRCMNCGLCYMPTNDHNTVTYIDELFRK